ncbi:sigma-54 interaction domain-containing protein [Paramaledivibacter caminithermalis]|uniref:Arginine utilization regulatory protein n=1 Tax=Paramaledivibacter caminithermalis (strain DSM 15212 / CIP 107654 / DViRD3) TaxID=1121301 RepID=A0A1M6KGJ0_PARC5|nr:sigma 54-interacting transcriptional regulator [Paramaledivibacter caminithermalis]SHJ57992.1 arginine utilization regulatory protein [Paramaledivibacter caminithermalis DSM 15212]
MKNLLNEKNMEIILDYVSDGIQIIDKKGRIVYCNRTAAILDDINREDVIGKHVFHIYPSLKEHTSTLFRVLEVGVPIYNVEQTFTNYKGKKITTINSTLPIKVNGRIAGAIEISRNITDVKALSEKVIDLQSKIYGDRNKVNIKNDEVRFSFDDIIGNSKEILKIKSIAAKAAMTSSPILVCGDTGTGKELLVQAIHNAGLRRNNSFVAQNCAALPSNLLEGILFGTVKGSFTDAGDRPGLFELANGGTLFLDEINSMPIQLQSKLLRVLQDGRVRRLGDIKTTKVDVRVIAATNIQPQEAVEKGYLRKDLYYRINTLTIDLPDLKDRKEDIPLLTEHFIKKYNKVLYRNVKGISGEVASIFQSYDWPGNIRELEHVIEGAMNIIDGPIITIDYLPKNLIKFYEKVSTDAVSEKLPLKVALEKLEKKMIKDALKRTDNNISQAALFLEIPRQTLQYKMKKYEL